MAATPSIRVVKEFTYRGSLRRYSNRYHFNGGTPADNAHWTTLCQAIGPYELNIIPSDNHVVEYVGYAAGSELPVFSLADNSAGGFATAGAIEMPGDSACVLRWNTTARSVRNHPIYLFNYFHDCFRQAGTDPD